MSLVDVIVVNYRTPGDLRDFCNSLRTEEAWIKSLTIVNNDPRPVDERIAEEINDDFPALIVNHYENIGYARAVNQAAVDLSASILGIFNADVLVQPGSIDSMVGFLRLCPDVGIAGPKQVDAKARITHGGITGSNERPKLRGWLQRDQGQFNDVLTDCVSVSGSAYFVKRSCWDELTSCEVYQRSVKELTGETALGAFLPTPHYYEETFASVHARSHGWKVGYNGRSTMTHFWQGSSKDLDQLSKFSSVSRKLFRAACKDHGIPHD